MPLLSFQQLEKLRDIIRDASEALAISTTGMDVSEEELQRLVDEGYIDLDEMENLVLDSFDYGRLLSQLPVAQHMDYSEFKQWVQKNPMALSERERIAYHEAKDRAGRFCVGLGSRFAGELDGEVVKLSEDLAQQFREGIRDEVSQSIVRRDSISQLTTHLRQMSHDWARDWHRIANTESQFASEQGKLEDTIKRHGNEAMMAKVPEPTACFDCKKHYLDETGMPIIRPASWWHAQGVANFGLKRADWKPVMGAMHPWCQCRLIRVPAGMEFNDQWDLVPKEERPLKKAGPYIGPRGGKWADAKHTIPWKDKADKIRYRKTASKNGVRISAFSGKKKIGHLLVVDMIHRFEVNKAEVLEPYRRKGIALQMYQMAGEHAASKGKKMRSRDFQRSPLAEKVWKALERRGRAVKKYDSKNDIDHWEYVPKSEAKSAPKPEWINDPDAYQTIHSMLPHPVDQIFSVRDIAMWAPAFNDPDDFVEAIKLVHKIGVQGREREDRYAKEHRDPEEFERIKAYISQKNQMDYLKLLEEPQPKRTDSTMSPTASGEIGKSAHKLHYRTEWNGLPISIENRKGSTRYWYDKGTDTHGETLMHFPYGYIRMTEAMDGDHVDVFIGPNENAKFVYVVHQRKAPEFTEYDEDKVMLGFNGRSAAKKAYLMHYDTPKFFGDMIAIPTKTFVAKCLAGKYRKGSKITKSRPPGSGWQPIPRTKRSGYRRKKGDRYEYWYPKRLSKKEKWLARETARMLAKEERAKKLIKLGGEYAADNGYFVVIPDPSHPGKVRTQRYDQDGFYGHTSYDTLEKLIADIQYTKFKPAPGTLDAFSQTRRWAEGTARADIMQVVNSIQTDNANDIWLAVNRYVNAAPDIVEAAKNIRLHASELRRGKIPGWLRQYLAKSFSQPIDDLIAYARLKREQRPGFVQTMNLMKSIYNAEGLAITGAAPNRPPVNSMGHVGNPPQRKNARAIKLPDSHPSHKGRIKKLKRKKTDEPAKRKQRMLASVDPRYRDWARPLPDNSVNPDKNRNADRNMAWLESEQARRAKRSEHREMMNPKDIF